jgi:LuxR family maltose regulon positive regulatory protein
MLAQADAIAEQESVGPDARDQLTRFATVLAIAMRELDRARGLVDQIRDPFWQAVATARVYLAEGRRENVLTVLDDLIPRCLRHEIILNLLVAQAENDRDEATKHASIATEKASAAGALQIVVSEGAAVTDMVERIAWRLPPRWVDRYRRAIPSADTTSGALQLIERLTDRERDVLRFLPSRLTVREIADELFVSVNTLKFHLKVIYRKLGVSSRAEASEAARRMAHVSFQG